jgi:hypothetical protein
LNRSPLFHCSKLLLPSISRVAPERPKRRASWQTSGFIVQWGALHRILGDISTPRVPILRFSRRETSSHFAAIPVVPTRAPIGFCKRSRRQLHFEHERAAFSGGVLTLESVSRRKPCHYWRNIAITLIGPSTRLPNKSIRALLENYPFLTRRQEVQSLQEFRGAILGGVSNTVSVAG